MNSKKHIVKLLEHEPLHHRIIKIKTEHKDNITHRDVILCAHLAAKLNYSIHPSTYRSMLYADATEDIHDLTDLIYTKIHDLFTTNFSYVNYRKFFDILSKTGLLKQYLYVIYQMQLTDQDSEFHPEGDVYEHTMQVIHEVANLTIEPKVELFYAALFHDTGKPDTFTITKSGKIGNPKHAEISCNIASVELNKTTLNVKSKTLIIQLIKYHMEMHKLLQPDTSDKTIRKMMTQIDLPAAIVLLAADLRGRQPMPQEKALAIEIKINELTSRVEELTYGPDFGKLSPLITSDDLINIGFTPGKRFIDDLNFAKNRQIEGWSRTEVLEHFQKEYYRSQKFKNQ